MDQSTLLNQIGLSEKEANLYQLMLELGAQPAGKVVLTADMPRGTVYEILNQLTEKGLIDQYQNNKNVTVFRAKHPYALKEYIENQKTKIEQTESQLDSVFADFVNLYSTAQNRPGVKFYEGREGIIKIYEEILRENKPIDSIEEKGDMNAYIPDYVPIFVKKRVNKKLPNRVISPDTNVNNITNPDKFITAKTIPADKFPFRMDIKITGQKVSLITFNGEQASGILIDNKEIADNFQMLFDFLWGKV